MHFEGRFKVKLMALIVLAGILAGCVSSTSTATGPIKIGVVANQTTDYALAGMYLLNGLELAVEELNAAGGVNGRQLELSVADAAKDNTTGVNAANKIFSEKPVAVFLPIYSTQVLAILPELKKNPFVTFTLGSNPAITKQGLDYVFRPRPNDGTIAAAATYAAVDKLGKKKLGLLYVNNEYGIGGAKVMKETAAKIGATIIGDEAYAATDKDFRAQLKKLVDQGAEVILLWGHPGDSGLVIKQRKELNISVPLLSGVTILSPSVIGLVTDEEMDGVNAVIDQVAVPNKSPSEEIRQWAETYNKKFGKYPDYSSFAYYNAMKLLAKALESGTDHATLRKAVAEIKFSGLGGVEYAFDEFGDVVQNVALIKFKGRDPVVQETNVRSR